MSTRYTENGDDAYESTGSDCLDFFTRITRGAPLQDYIQAFIQAWRENKEIAVKILMNLRDVRNGKGEKLISIVLLVYLKMTIEEATYQAILEQMIKYGCWKDLLKIIEIENRLHLEMNKKKIPMKKSIEIEMFANQLRTDCTILESDKEDDHRKAISLCAKWAPSEKTHYNHFPIFAAKNIMAELLLTPKEYRLMLSKMRKHLNVLELLMSTQQFDKIDFSKLPSVAIMKMKKAFSRDSNAEGEESELRKNLHLSYRQYLENLSKGKTKVNIKGIQPHELVSTYISNQTELDELVEAQWKALKERIKQNGVFRDVTAIVDVSGSMYGQPIEVAIALGILVAECTIGPFYGKMITFHEKPSWHILTGDNLLEQVQCVKKAEWGSSTNMRAVFDLILNTAKKASLTQDEMVKTLFIFTDMQFDHCDRHWESAFDYAKRTFNEAGYQLPKIVCWNLRTSVSKSLPARQDTENMVMLSGFSAELLKCILDAKEFTPISMMMHILEPYDVPIEVSQSIAHDLTHPNTNFINFLEKAVQKSQFKKAFRDPKDE